MRHPEPGAEHNLSMAYALGFCSRTGSAAAVAVETGTHRFGGRWEVELGAPGTPVQLYHAAAGMEPDRSESFVRAGVDNVTAVAVDRLRELVAELGPVEVVGVVTGNHPMPDDVPVIRILAAHTMMHAAEGQLYRDALLDAATARGLAVHAVPQGRAENLLSGSLAGAAADLGRAAGRPWRKQHKLAAVAALVAAGH